MTYLELATIEDCIEMYEKKGQVAIINDGQLVGFEDDENKK